MIEESPNEITKLLYECGNGDKLALEQLMPLVYGELHKMAKQYMRSEGVGHTLQTTALIHEAYLKIVRQEEQNWENRAHFFGVAAHVMRSILLDYLRRKGFQKRGGNAGKVELEEMMMISSERAVGLIELDEALTRLAEVDERKSRVVELKYFGGLSNEEMAEVLSVTPRTIIRDWQYARSWLLRELSNQ